MSDAPTAHMTPMGPTYTTVPGALAGRSTSDPESPFLITDKATVSFAELEARAEALAASLSSLGIEAGDRVAVVMPAWVEFVVSMFAISKLGAVMVPLNPYLTAPELQYMLRHSETVAAKIRQCLSGSATHHVEALVHLSQCVWIKRFETHQHPLTATPFHKFQGFVVVRNVDCGLADPTDLQRD